MIKIPFLDLKRQYDNIKDEINDAVKRIIDSQRFILGDEVSEFEERIAGSSTIQERIQQQSDRQSCNICQQVIGRHSSEADERLCTLCTYGQEQSKYNSEECSSSEFAKEPSAKNANNPGDEKKTKVDNFVHVLEPSGRGYLCFTNWSQQQAEKDECPQYKNSNTELYHCYT